MRKWTRWFNRETEYVKPRPAIAPLPVIPPGEGHLELHSPTWKFVGSYAQRELESLRIRLENVSLTEIETAVTRGEIRMAKKLLALSIPTPQVEPASDDY